MNETEPIVFGSTEFWSFYDEFCKSPSIVKLNYKENYPDAERMHAITKAAHLNREIHRLKRPERGWERHHAWLSLKHAEIRREDGTLALLMRAGDVVAVEHGWDRDVFITHAPIHEWICGDLLSGKQEAMIGLFLPLFNETTITRCINIRINKNAEEGYDRAERAAKEWGWY